MCTRIKFDRNKAMEYYDVSIFFVRSPLIIFPRAQKLMLFNFDVTKIVLLLFYFTFLQLTKLKLTEHENQSAIEQKYHLLLFGPGL